MSGLRSLHTMNLFSRFFQENQEKFLAFAYSYLRDKAEAEDVVMESMIALWENRDRWEENSNLHALLLTIIKNKALHVLEHKQVRLRAEETISSHNLRELDLRISTLKACEPDKIFNTEIQHIVNKTLQEMPEQSRRKKIRTNGMPAYRLPHGETAYVPTTEVFATMPIKNGTVF